MVDVNRHALRGDISEGEVDAHCRDYKRRISRLHGIDFQLLGIGRNSRIGFNEPGSLPADRTRSVSLTDETRDDAAVYLDRQAARLLHLNSDVTVIQ